MSELLTTTHPLLPVSDEFLADGDIQELEHRFGFKIGRCQFVLAKTLTTEILIKPSIYNIPNSPAWVFGMVNVRGNILPIIDIASILRTDYLNNPGDYVLVIDRGRKSLAILIDALPKLLNEPTEAERLGETNRHIDEFLKPGVQEGKDIWDQLEIKGLVDSMQDSKKS